MRNGWLIELYIFRGTATIHSFYSEFAVLEEEIREKSDLWATHGFVSVTHSQPSQTLKFTHKFTIQNVRFTLN